MQYLKMDRDTSQAIVLAVFMFIVILVVLIFYFYRWTLFGPVDLSKYGTMSAYVAGNCIVPNVAEGDVKCTDVGMQTSVSTCTPNPDTGYYCLMETTPGAFKQTANVSIKNIECIPPCIAYKFVQNYTSPCLVIDDVNGATSKYEDPKFSWCNRPGLNSARFRTYTCNANDGSGLNSCIFQCGQGIDNADCTQVGGTTASIGTTLIYSPTDASLAGTSAPVQLVYYPDGTHYYTPISSADINFPIIPSNAMTTKENCADIAGDPCGTWIDTAPPTSTFLSTNCVVFSNLTPNLDPSTPNTPSNLYESGLSLTDLVCSGVDVGVANPNCYPDSGNCVPPSSIIGLIPTLTDGVFPDICGEASYDANGNITAITKPERKASLCIYLNPELSLTWAGRFNFYYRDPNDTINIYKGIISVPLFMSNSTGYLSLFNAPCPNFTAVNLAGNISYTFTNGSTGFIDSQVTTPPALGIPFRFDGHGNPVVGVQPTPCVWIPTPLTPPSSLWGLPPQCDVLASGGQSPVFEATALMLLIRPIQTTATFVKCNIVGLFGSSYSGWLTWATSNTVPGYTWGQGNSLGLTNKIILMWNQGRFDPFAAGALPGNNVSSLGIFAVFIITINPASTPSNPLYDINNSNMVPVLTIGTNTVGSNSTSLTGVSFSPMTTKGLSVAKTMPNGKVEIDGLLLSQALYARQNRSVNGLDPSCNMMLPLN